MTATWQVTKSPHAASFAEMLKAFRARAGLSRNRLAIHSHIDPSFLTRIENGQRDPPRRPVVDSIMDALRLSSLDRNKMLAASGFVPESVEQIGEWSDCLQAVASVLSDPFLSPEERDRFSDVVQSIAERWGNPRPGERAKVPLTTAGANGVEAHHV